MTPEDLGCPILQIILSIRDLQPQSQKNNLDRKTRPAMSHFEEMAQLIVGKYQRVG